MQKHFKALALIAGAAAFGGLMAQPAFATNKSQAEDMCSKNPRCQNKGDGFLTVVGGDGKNIEIYCPATGACYVLHKGLSKAGANRATSVLANPAGPSSPKGGGLHRGGQLSTKSDLSSGGLRADGLKSQGLTGAGLSATGSSLGTANSRMGASSASKPH